MFDMKNVCPRKYFKSRKFAELNAKSNRNTLFEFVSFKDYRAIALQTLNNN